MARKSDYSSTELKQYVELYVKEKSPKNIKVSDVVSFCNEELSLYPPMTKRRLTHNPEAVSYIAELNYRLRGLIYEKGVVPTVISEYIAPDLIKNSNTQDKAMTLAKDINTTIENLIQINQKLSKKCEFKEHEIQKLTARVKNLESNIHTATAGTELSKKKLNKVNRENRKLKSINKQLMDYINTNVTEAAILKHFQELGLLSDEEKIEPVVDIPVGDVEIYDDLPAMYEGDVISQSNTKWIESFSKLEGTL